jgi:beta-glucosidase
VSPETHTAKPDSTDPHTFDTARHAVASGADPVAEARRVVAAMTEDERLWCLDGDAPCWAGLGYLQSGGYHRLPFVGAQVGRLAVPGIAFSDGPRGVVVNQATCFPVSMARGAAWDPDLEERIGEAIGQELRAVGANLYGGVCVNVLRHPAWGRAQETYGEDPHHVGELGAALTRGVQRHALACVKHFACNSMENARFEVDVTVDEIALHEVFLPQFKRIVDEGVAVVMSAYNQVNGEWCGDSHELLTAILRDEWGFDGFVISDWIFGLRDAAASVAAGLDIEMPYRMIRAMHLRAALDDGSCTWEQVDAAVTRVVSTLLRFDAVLDTPRPAHAALASTPHRALAREAATKSIVVLRNEPVDGRPVLPLTTVGAGGVAVIGRLGDLVNLGDGGSSDVWAPDAVTIAEGLRRSLPDHPVLVDDGSDLERAGAAANAADLAVVVVGYTREDEGEFIGDAGTQHLMDLFPGPDDPDLAARFEEATANAASIEAPPHVRDRASMGFSTGGDRRSLRLHDHDVALIRAVAAANPHTVVAVVAGSAVLMSEWIDAVPAVVMSWYGGMEAGPAFADVLLGRAEATGRLPFSIPASEDHLPDFDAAAKRATYDAWHGWWKLDRDGHQPAFPFGFGLSYTTFELDRPALVSADGGEIGVEVTVRNTGDRPGTELGRVEVRPGASEDLRLPVRLESLHERDVLTHAMALVPGHYDLTVARHASDPTSQTLSVALPWPAEGPVGGLDPGTP